MACNVEEVLKEVQDRLDKSKKGSEEYNQLLAVKSQLRMIKTVSSKTVDIENTVNDISVPEALNINYGTNENKELSNLAYRPFTYMNKTFESVEHAYQTYKSGTFDEKTYSDSRWKKVRQGDTIKVAGVKGTKTIDNWNIKLMSKLIRESFKQNPKAVSILLDTENKKLVHNQGDAVWKIRFPELLTKEREYFSKLKNSSGDKTGTVIKSEREEFDKLPSKSNTATMKYAGIGSRETPQHILNEMTKLAQELDKKGYELFTGKTFYGKEEGADAAFSRGTTNKQLFAPEDATPITMKIASEIHPNWEAVSRSKGAVKLMARNTFQIFGKNLNTPVDFVVFYADETSGIRPKGGTGQAVEMARRKGIPTINLKNSNWKEELLTIINSNKSANESKKEFKTDTIQDLENAVNETPLDKVQEMLECKAKGH